MCGAPATHVDHIVTWRQGGAPFDPVNLRATCRKCNLGRVSRARRSGWLRAATHVILVWGPPAAGKSTLVGERAAPGDVVVDYDAIAVSLGATRDSPQHKSVMAARNALLTMLQRGESGADRAWIVSTRSDAPARFIHHEAILVDPGEQVCLERAAAAGRPAREVQAIGDWYAARSTAGSDLLPW
jgi:hypothetical protein